MTGKPACPDNVLEFLHLEECQAVSVVLKYKAKLIDKGLKEATVNRRLIVRRYHLNESQPNNTQFVNSNSFSRAALQRHRHKIRDLMAGKNKL